MCILRENKGLKLWHCEPMDSCGDQSGSRGDSTAHRKAREEVRHPKAGDLLFHFDFFPQPVLNWSWFMIYAEVKGGRGRREREREKERESRLHFHLEKVKHLVSDFCSRLGLLQLPQHSEQV